MCRRPGYAGVVWVSRARFDPTARCDHGLPPRPRRAPVRLDCGPLARLNAPGTVRGAARSSWRVYRIAAARAGAVCGTNDYVRMGVRVCVCICVVVCACTCACV